MTSQERTLLALKGKKPDRVPIQLFGSTGYSPLMEAYGGNFAKLLSYAKEHADILYGWQEPLGSCYTTMYTGTWVEEHATLNGRKTLTTRTMNTPLGPISQISETDDETTSDYRLRKHFVETDEDFERLMSLPFVPFRPDTSKYHNLKELACNKAVVSTFITGPLDVAALYLQPTEFVFWTIERKEQLHAMLAKIHANMSNYLEWLLQNGIGEVFWFGGAEQVVPPLGHPDFFQEFVTKYEKPFVDRIHKHGGICILHCHGRISQVLEQIANTGYDAVQPLEPSPMGDITIAEAKKMVGDRMCLIGNIQIGDIFDKTPDQIDQLCKEAIEQGKPGGGFILGITASYYSKKMSDKVLENYIAYIDAGRKYGHY